MARAALHDVLQLQRDLKKAATDEDKDRVMDLLEALGRVSVNLELLQETKVGTAVKPLKKWVDPDVSLRARQLIDAWKSVANAPAALVSSTPSSASPSASKPPRVVLKLTKPDAPVSSSGKAEMDEHTPPVRPPSSLVKADPEAADACPEEATSGRPNAYASAVSGTRQQAREKLRQVLSIDYDGPPVFVIAERIENAMDAKFPGNIKGYSDKFRQLLTNIKKNAELKYALNRESVTAERLVSMTPQELAPKHLQAKRAQMASDQRESRNSDWQAKHDDAIRERYGLGSVAGMYSCGRCKSEKIKNSEAQTRSADEPMTQFFVCLDCGNRWRF